MDENSECVFDALLVELVPEKSRDEFIFKAVQAGSTRDPEDIRVALDYLARTEPLRAANICIEHGTREWEEHGDGQNYFLRAVEILEKLAETTADSGRRTDLLGRAARIHLEYLNNPDGAILSYAKALMFREAEAECLTRANFCEASARTSADEQPKTSFLSKAGWYKSKALGYATLAEKLKLVPGRSSYFV